MFERLTSSPYKHPSKPNVVTIPGHLGDDVPKGTLKSNLESGRIREQKMRVKYAVLFEKADNNLAAYVPDLPGCMTTCKTLEETEKTFGRQLRDI